MHLYDSPLRKSRAAREPELPGAPAVGTSLGHLSHITAKSKKLSENGVNYCLPKIVMKGEETQSWVRPPYASSHRELLEGPVFTLLTADFFSAGRDILTQPTVCLLCVRLFTIQKSSKSTSGSHRGADSLPSLSAWTEATRGGCVALHIEHTEPHSAGSEKEILTLRNRTGASRKKWRCWMGQGKLVGAFRRGLSW